MILYNPTVSGSLLVTGSLTTTGTITSQTLVVQTITSSIEFNTGSTRNGTLSTNTHEFTGSVSITGSAAALLSVNNDILYVSSSGNIGIGVTSISPISTYKTLEIRGATGGGIKLGKTGFNPLNIQHDGTDAYLNNVANGSFNIYTNDSPRLYISSSGNVGIGTTSPSQALHVRKNGTTSAIVIDSQNTSYQATLYYARDQVNKWEMGLTSTNEDWYLYGTNEAIYVKRSNGVVTFKSTSTNMDTLTVCNNSGKVNVKIGGAGGGANYGGISMLDISSNERLYLITDATSHSYMYSGLVIGDGSGAYKLTLNGQPGANGYTAWTNYSDLRLKENIEPFVNTNILDKISLLNPVTFNYNEVSGYDEETRARRISGFIAQELQEIFPEMVGTLKLNDEEYLDTNLSNLSLYLVKAIQELSAKNTALEEILQRNNIQ
jgi:hypothetical protein